MKSQDQWHEACTACNGSRFSECSCLSHEGHNPRFCDARPCTACDGTGLAGVQQALAERRAVESDWLRQKHEDDTYIGAPGHVDSGGDTE